MKYILLATLYSEQEAKEKLKRFILAVFKLIGLSSSKLPKIESFGNDTVQSEFVSITKAQFEKRLEKLSPIKQKFRISQHSAWNKESHSGDYLPDDSYISETLYSFECKIPSDKILFTITYSKSYESKTKKANYSLKFFMKYDHKKETIKEPVVDVSTIRNITQRATDFYSKFKKFAKDRRILLDIKRMYQVRTINNIEYAYNFNLVPYFSEIADFLKKEYKNKVSINTSTDKSIKGTLNTDKFSCNITSLKGRKFVQIIFVGNF